MNPDADVALLSESRLAGVQAHAHLDLHALRPLVRGEVALCVERCGDGVLRGVERDEEGIALCVHHPPAMRGERGPQNLLMSCEELVVELLADAAQQSGRALDVAEQKGDGPGWEFALAHDPQASPRAGGASRGSRRGSGHSPGALYAVCSAAFAASGSVFSTTK